MAGFNFKIGHTGLGTVLWPRSHRIVLQGRARLTSLRSELVVNGKTYTVGPAPMPGAMQGQMMGSVLKLAGLYGSAVVVRGELQGLSLGVASIEIGRFTSEHLTTPLRYAEGRLVAKPVDSGPVRVVAAAGADPAVFHVLQALAGRNLSASITATIDVVGGVATLEVSGVAFGDGHTATR